MYYVVRKYRVKTSVPNATTQVDNRARATEVFIFITQKFVLGGYAWNAQCFLPSMPSESVEDWGTLSLHRDLLEDAPAGLLWHWVPLLIQSNDPDCKR